MPRNVINLLILQDLYGMNSKSNYKKQAERNLERAVAQGQMTVSDYYTKKAEVQTSNVGGVDDGHSCTKGNLLQILLSGKGRLQPGNTLPVLSLRRYGTFDSVTSELVHTKSVKKPPNAG